jgi:Uma2 family endonuclease
MVSQPVPRLTEAEYLALDDASPLKHELYRGQMYAMSGGSSNHSKIQVALIRHIDIQLDGRNCTTYGSEMRVRVADSGLYTYPDLSVVCGTPEFLTPSETTLLNPVVIVEVLSPSTEAYDRGNKFHCYESLPSLKHYVLVSSESALIDVLTRGASGNWDLRTYRGPDGSLDLPAIGVTIPIAEIYAKVTFDPPEHP